MRSTIRPATVGLILSILLTACGGGAVGGLGSGSSNLQPQLAMGTVPGSFTTAERQSVRVMPDSVAASMQIPSTDTSDANAIVEAAYCSQTGGLYEVRRAAYNTNGLPSQWLPLNSVRGFCEYTAKDGSRIHILLSTLYAQKPTLAALAYILKPAIGSCPGGANPASCYCSQLGGSDQFGGTNPMGGGWVMRKSIDQVLEACIFPDMSSIDSWGLAYHAYGVIRGIDLTKVMRYHYTP